MSDDQFGPGVGEYFEHCSSGAVDWAALAAKRRRLGLYYPLAEVFENPWVTSADRERAARDYQADYWQYLRESAQGNASAEAAVELIAARYGQSR
jgi:hypothetical protein